MDYFLNIDNSTLSNICSDLITKYTENRKLEKKKNAKRLFILYAKNDKKKLSDSLSNWNNLKYNYNLYIYHINF